MSIIDLALSSLSTYAEGYSMNGSAHSNGHTGVCTAITSSGVHITPSAAHKRLIGAWLRMLCTDSDIEGQSIGANLISITKARVPRSISL